jgi:hypothetical protein
MQSNPNTNLVTIPPGFWKGFWEVIQVIAARTPSNQLFKLTALICLFVLLVLALMAYSVRSVVTSKPAAALAQRLSPDHKLPLPSVADD